MSYLDDNLPDFSNLSLPEDGLVSMPTTVPTATNPIPAASSSLPIGNMISAGGDIISGIGGYMQGQEEAGADEYNANLALMEGQFQVEQIGEEESETLATQKAMYAKAGVEQEGSVLDVAMSTATQYEYSKQVAMFNAKSAATMDNYEAAMAKSKGDFALAGGLLSGAGALMGLTKI